MYQYFKLYFLIFTIIFTACRPANRQENLNKFDPADSILLTGVFHQMLLPGANEDSLLTVAGEMFNREPLLDDVFYYNTLRNDIMKGRMAKADSTLTGIYEQYLADSVNYKWAKYLNLMASVAAFKIQQNDAVMYFQKALKLTEDNDDKLQSATIRFNLANIFLSRTDYKTAHEYGTEAYALLKEIDDKQYLPLIKGLLAVTTLHTNNNLTVADDYATKALALSKENNNIQGLLLGYYAKGEVLVKQDKFLEAIEPLKNAKELGEKFQQKQIVTSTGASLLVCYLGLKDYNKAINEGLKTLELAREIGNSDIKYSLNKNLGESYSRLGDYENAYIFTQKAEQQYREKSNKENQEIIQNLLISFESEKKNNIILTQENKLQERFIWIIILVALTVLILSILFLLQRISINKHKALQTQKEKEVLQALTDGEEMERSRVSGELHDGIGSQLTAIKLSLENTDNKEQNQKPLEMVQEVLREVRMVAHNILPMDFETNTLAVALEEFCTRSSTDSLPIKFVSNAYDLMLPKNIAHSIFRVVQELVQNAAKHSDADNIYVQCLKGKDALHLNIEDNGQGIDENELTSTDSFRFLKRRLKRLGADFNIDSAKGKGTIVQIVLKTDKL